MARGRSARQRKLNVLFLCTGNACRSQMCEGWARELAGDVIEAWSAGVTPHGLDPRAAQVMAEVGIDISGQSSKSWETLSDVAFDYVITVCDSAAESCPVFPGTAERLHRSFDDPPRLARDARNEQEALDHYRRVRDAIRAFVETLPGMLTQRNQQA